MHAQSLQLCLTFCDAVDCSPPISAVHGILQARILEWVVMPSSRKSSWPRDGTYVACVSCTVGGSLLLSHWGSPIIGYYLLSIWPHWFLFYSYYNLLLWLVWCSGCTRLDTGTKPGPKTGWRPESPLEPLACVLILLWPSLPLELGATVTGLQAAHGRRQGIEVGGSVAKGVKRSIPGLMRHGRICCFLSDHSCIVPF